LRAQLKYGTRASSGGGRSSARETIGRVAAGAIAEKWLFQTFGTRIVTWVNSIGDVSIPEEVVAEKGCAWTRQEVDDLGALNLLRDPSTWPIDLEALTGTDAAAKAAELGRKASFEKAFLALPESDATPAYRDAVGKIYTRSGDLIAEPPANIAAWLTDDLVSLRCPHPPTSCKMATLIRHVKDAKDSIGGTLTTVCTGVPPALGEPVFDRIEAKLAHAMLSLPATKGFEIGTGFRGAARRLAACRLAACRARYASSPDASDPLRLLRARSRPRSLARAGTVMRGSAHNDPFVANDVKGGGKLTTKTNNAGGTLGGITVGTPIEFRVALKAVSTIGQAQHTSTFDGSEVVLEAKGRHDPCVLPRAPPLLEGMAAIVIADAVMMQRTRLGGSNTIADPRLIHGHPDDAEAGSAKKQRAE
jgi:chorismate synthase